MVGNPGFVKDHDVIAIDYSERGFEALSNSTRTERESATAAPHPGRIVESAGVVSEGVGMKPHFDRRLGTDGTEAGAQG